MTAPLWTSLLYGEPLAISAFRNETLCQAAEARLTGIAPDKIDATTLAFKPNAMSHEASHYRDGERKPFRMKNEIAVIETYGTMTKRGDFMDAESGLIGYNRLLQQMRAAVNDPEVKGLFWMVDSPGGHTARLFETANEIALLAKAEGGKPIYAYLDEQACSAAAVLTSSADVVLGPRGCLGGSLGVLCNILDTSRLYDKAGIKPVVIRSSWADRKARPQEGEAVDKEAVDGFQRLVDEMSDQLVEYVAAMRGISEKSIRDLRGEVFGSTDLLRFGLIDEICSEREAWALLEAEVRS